MSIGSVEVVYRGVYQKTLARNICRGVVLAARKEAKSGIAFSRYGDSPERNGIPAKQFAVVSDSPEELEEYLSRYEADDNDVTIVLDDTLCGGIESWGWHGVQPINVLLKDGGTLLVTSMQAPNQLVRRIHRKSAPYDLALLEAPASFSGMWVYRPDRTDMRLLGALAKVAPHVVTMESIASTVAKTDEAVASLREGYDEVRSFPVTPEEGAGELPPGVSLPGAKTMAEGLVIRGIAVRSDAPCWEGGYIPGRNSTFRKSSTRTMRPVVDFASCTKCSICWLQCPDTSFDIAPDGFYDVNMEACCGCAVCEAVCPVEGCITMIGEEAFDETGSQWRMWSEDATAYAAWLAEKKAAQRPRSHGFHHRGQYAEELAT